jgi:large conductance mechanosensitive channel
MLKEFKEFAVKGNMLDMAVGIIIGAAFATIVGSLVADMLGGVDFADLFVILKQGDPAGPYATLALAQEAGAVTLNWGVFINSVITFLIVALAVFFVVRGFNKMKQEEEAAEETPAEPEPTAEEVLLGEIRDLLKAQSGA